MVATLVTDEAHVGKEFAAHERVKFNYVNAKGFTTNHVENFFGVFKRVMKAHNWIAHMTLIATRFLPGSDGIARHDHAITAHLRMNMPTLMALKKTIEAIENMNKPPEGTPMN